MWPIKSRAEGEERNQNRVIRSFMGFRGFTLLGVSLAFLPFFIPQASAAVCVLNFEARIHPFSRTTEQIFRNIPEIRLIHEAVPLDFINCVRDDFSEIVLIAHALEDPQTRDVRLGYIKKIETASEAHYELKAFLPKAFQLARAHLESKRQANHPIALRQIRLLSCLPKQVLAAYPDWGALMTENQIHLDVAPRQVLMSTLKRKTLTTLDRLWLAESAQTHPKWFYTYLNLKTLGLYQYGRSTALQAQYRIRYRGIALGLANKWTKVFIRYRDVKGMEVGERRWIRTPKIDVSAAFWFNLELGLLPKAYVKWPSEINSLGADLTLMSFVQIERLY